MGYENTCFEIEDKEEQRRAKELMREEQKAKREYEKAMREAQKEEALIEKAMEKARASLEAAHEDEKNKYEKEIRELRLKWEEAEERNKRAISMAQQTKRGHVYIISNIGSFGEDVYKIGMTRRLDPLDRVKELGDASVPFLFDVHSIIFSEDAPSLGGTSQEIDDDRRVNKVNLRKEFFNVKISEIKEIIDAEEWIVTGQFKPKQRSLGSLSLLNLKVTLQKILISPLWSSSLSIILLCQPFAL